MAVAPIAFANRTSRVNRSDFVTHQLRRTRVPDKPPITSAYAPDVEAVRVWLEEMIAAVSFTKLVVAI